MDTSASWPLDLGWLKFMREQLHKPVPSPVVLGQITERFRAAVKELAEREQIPIYEFRHKQDQEKSPMSSGASGVRGTASYASVWPRRKRRLLTGRKSMGSCSLTATRRFYGNHYYFYIDNEEFGPLFLKI